LLITAPFHRRCSGTPVIDNAIQRNGRRWCRSGAEKAGEKAFIERRSAARRRLSFARQQREQHMPKRATPLQQMKHDDSARTFTPIQFMLPTAPGAAQRCILPPPPARHAERRGIETMPPPRCHASQCSAARALLRATRCCSLRRRITEAFAATSCASSVYANTANRQKRKW